VIHADEAML
jgi:hypothetical protein